MIVGGKAGAGPPVHKGVAQASERSEAITDVSRVEDLMSTLVS
jgi:hypothetical protein